MKNPFQPRRLAVLYPKAIGDFMFVLPALHTLRRAFPETFLVLVVKQKQAPLALPQKGLLADEVLVIGGGNGLWQVRGQLTALDIDTVLDLAGNDQTGLLMTWGRGCRFRPHPRDCKGYSFLYAPFSNAMPPRPPGEHRVEELLGFAASLGRMEPVYSFRLRLPETAIEACEQMINRHDLRTGRLIVLNIGASRQTKCWPAEHFSELARACVSKGYRVALMGAKRFPSDGDYDRRTVERFIKEGVVDGERCVDLVTDHDLSPGLQLQRDAFFLRYSGIPMVAVGNDTGPLHIAGSVGEDAHCKTVSLFGPTNWGRYAPYDPSRVYPDQPAGRWNRVVCIDSECGPAGTQEACACYRRGCRNACCMSGLSVENVLHAVMQSVGSS